MRSQRRLVGIFQRAIVSVQPENGRFQRQPAVERGTARIAMRQVLGTECMAKDVGKLGLQEGELRHSAGSDLDSVNLAVVVSQLAPKRAMLERGEQRVKLSEMGAVIGL
jgi:hypothetical protein